MVNFILHNYSAGKIELNGTEINPPLLGLDLLLSPPSTEMRVLFKCD